MKINGLKLKLLVKGSGLTQEEAAKRLGVSRQALSSWFKHEELDDDILQNVKSNLFPDIDIDPSSIDRISKMETSGQIPIFNFPAAAGGVEVYNDPNDVKIIGHLNIPGAHKNSFALPAYGHSMYPTLANGDLGIVRPIEDPNEIAWGEVYYIEWADYKMYKRLLLADDEDKVILWSDNQEDKIGTRAKYSPITIKKEKIRKLCLVTEILKKPNY